MDWYNSFAALHRGLMKNFFAVFDYDPNPPLLSVLVGILRFIVVWPLLLTYLSYARMQRCSRKFRGCGPNYGVKNPTVWLVVGLCRLLIASVLAIRDMRAAGHFILALQAPSVLAIVLPYLIVLANVARTIGLSAAPFRPAPENNGWSGTGYAIVLTILCFAGFEGTATLVEKLRNPTSKYPSGDLCPR